MSIIKCKECGNEVSDKAATCPKCGAPVEKPIVSAPPKIQEEKKSSFSRFWWVLLVAVIVIAGITFINNPNTIPGIKIQINTPKPIVATQRADDADASVFNYKETVYATISNQGGDGNVLVNFHVTQAGKIYNKTMPIYMRAGQNLDVKEVFDEVARLDGEMKYWVDVQAR